MVRRGAMMELFKKYVIINDSRGIVGQDSKSGAWHIKELPFRDLKEMDQLICEAIKILNKYNVGKESKE